MARSYPPSGLSPGGSLIDPAMIRAYRETEYRILGARPFTLWVDEASAPLLAAHRAHDVACSAYLSACNPYSRLLDEAANRRLLEGLRKGLDRRGLAFLEAVGKHPSSGWPAEPSLLILGLDREAAMTLGAELHQNAILWCDADALPQLVLLR